MFITDITLPQFLGGWELLYGQFTLCTGFHIMFQETIAIGAVHKPNIKDFSIFDTLLHSCPEAVVIIFRFHDCQGQIGFIVQKVICFLPLATGGHVSANDHPAIREIVFHFDLALPVPSSSFNRRSNELKLNILLSHFAFFH